jgi:transposase
MDNTVKWQEIIAEKEIRIAELEALVKYYEEQFRLAQYRRFGASSEKTQYLNQISYFNEAEEVADPEAEEPELDIEEINYTRRKRKGKRDEDLSALPVEVIEHTLPEEEQICPGCDNAMHVIGHDVRRELKIIPAQAAVVEHRRAVYSCRECEKMSEVVPFVKAEMPAPVISGSLASPSAVAYIMTEKFVMFSPLYRQEQNFKRYGIPLSRQTMANWVIRCSEDWLSHIYERLRLELLKASVIHGDETTLQVLREPDRAAQTKSYMWLYRTSGDAARHVVIYEYQQTREACHPQEFLNGFGGYVHCDGYQAYHKLEGVIAIGCWAHMRRYFENALKVMPVAERKGSKAAKGEAFCNKLFKLERTYSKLSAEDRCERRLAESKPVAEQFFAWASSVAALPKTKLGEALVYAVNQKKWIMNFYLDGRLELSNNRGERSIKPFVQGRKNFLFSNTPNGAQSSAVVFSIIETAKENGLKPFEYLEFLLEKLPNTTTGGIDALLPWSDIIPSHCKMPKAKKGRKEDAQE